jgi:hypothetical protein
MGYSLILIMNNKREACLHACSTVENPYTECVKYMIWVTFFNCIMNTGMFYNHFALLLFREIVRNVS